MSLKEYSYLRDTFTNGNPPTFMSLSVLKKKVPLMIVQGWNQSGLIKFIYQSLCNFFHSFLFICVKKQNILRLYLFIYNLDNTVSVELPKLCYHPGWRLMRLGYRTCFHTLYDEKKKNNNTSSYMFWFLCLMAYAPLGGLFNTKAILVEEQQWYY